MLPLLGSLLIELKSAITPFNHKGILKQDPLAFAMKNFLKSLFRFPSFTAVKPIIESYGLPSSGIDPEQIQSVMEWLFLSLLNGGY